MLFFLIDTNVCFESEQQNGDFHELGRFDNFQDFLLENGQFPFIIYKKNITKKRVHTVAMSAVLIGIEGVDLGSILGWMFAGFVMHGHHET